MLVSGQTMSNIDKKKCTHNIVSVAFSTKAANIGVRMYVLVWNDGDSP